MKGPGQFNRRRQQNVMGVISGVRVMQSKGSTSPA